MRPLALVLTGLLLVSGALLVRAEEVPEPAAPPAKDAALVELASWMTGSFSSAAQAKAEPDDYLEIHLHMVRIWPKRTDGYWLYVEQALGRLPERPYRQRVYQVVAGEEAGAYESRVFELPDPKAAVGAWQEEAPLAKLAPDELVRREGCTVFLTKKPDGTFAGSTKDDACKSDFQGAAYATSEVTVEKERIVSWDRGYDADGNQVWGAVKGGYVFDQTKDHPLGE